MAVPSGGTKVQASASTTVTLRHPFSSTFLLACGSTQWQYPAGIDSVSHTHCSGTQQYPAGSDSVSYTTHSAAARDHNTAHTQSRAPGAVAPLRRAAQHRLRSLPPPPPTLGQQPVCPSTRPAG